MGVVPSSNQPFFVLELFTVSDFPKNVAKLLQEITRLYEQVALLVQTADTIFQASSWTPLNSYVIKTSSAISLPQQWPARTVRRFYGNSDAEPNRGNVLAFLSAFLFDPQQEKRTTTPTLTAGWLTFPPDMRAEANYQPTDSDYYLWLENAPVYGNIVTAERSAWPKWRIAWNRVSLLSFPLEEVINTQFLRDRVIQPVLDGVSAAT